MDLSAIVQVWAVPEPYSFVALTAGYMNLTQRVDSPAGSYVLRIYQAVSDPARIRHEHAVMQYLSGAGLSFHVPAPLRAATGATLVTVGGVGEPFALLRRLPGSPLRHGFYFGLHTRRFKRQEQY